MSHRLVRAGTRRATQSEASCSHPSRGLSLSATLRLLDDLDALMLPAVTVSRIRDHHYYYFGFLDEAVAAQQETTLKPL